MHQSPTPSLSQTIWPRWASRQLLSLPKFQTFLPVTFGYSLSSEAVVMRQLRRWKRLWQRSLTCWHKKTSMRPSRSCWNSTSALQQEEITSKRTRVSCVYYQWKCPYEKSLETYLTILVNVKTVLYITIQFTLSTVLTSKTVPFQTIQFSINTQFKCKYSLSKTFLFQAIQFGQTVLIQTIQFGISMQAV